MEDRQKFCGLVRISEVFLWASVFSWDIVFKNIAWKYWCVNVEMIFQNFFWHIVSHLTNEWHDYNHQKWWWSWNDPVSILKSVNLQYITLGCLDDGTNKSSTKSLMFQLLFFYTFYRLRAPKTLYFYNFIKKLENKLKGKNFARNHEKKYLEHQSLGRQFVCPIVQATQHDIF